MKAGVYNNGILAGILEKQLDGTYSFEYDEDAVITDKNGVEYSLTPDSDGGFTIVEVGDNDNGDTFTAKEVQRILDMM
jgi:hypothetical protein